MVDYADFIFCQQFIQFLNQLQFPEHLRCDASFIVQLFTDHFFTNNINPRYLFFNDTAPGRLNYIN